MKKVIALLFSMGIFMLAGQSFYTPSVRTTTYTELTNGVKQNESPGNPGRYLLSLPKPVKLFNETTGTDLTIGAGGFIVSQNPTHSFAIDPFLANLVEGSTNSGIYVEFDSSSVPYCMSIEWRNMIPVAHPITDYVNFTAHIYSDQSVEFHYGPSQITDTTAFNGGTGPSVFLILFQGVFGSPQEYHKMIGSPSNPTFGTAPSQSKLTGVPSNGTLYRYEPFNINLREDSKTRINLYPNPVKNRLFFEGNQATEAEIRSLNGSLISSKTFSQNSIDVSDLDKGIYLLKLKIEAKEKYIRFIKQ